MNKMIHDDIIDYLDCHNDKLAKMGKKELGPHNVLWGDKVGFLMLQKAIMNDYWADAEKDRAWPSWKVDMVMSKLYYCWVKLLEKEER